MNSIADGHSATPGCVTILSDCHTVIGTNLRYVALRERVVAMSDTLVASGVGSITDSVAADTLGVGTVAGSESVFPVNTVPVLRCRVPANLDRIGVYVHVCNFVPYVFLKSVAVPEADVVANFDVIRGIQDYRIPFCAAVRVIHHIVSVHVTSFAFRVGTVPVCSCIPAFGVRAVRQGDCMFALGVGTLAIRYTPIAFRVCAVARRDRATFGVGVVTAGFRRTFRVCAVARSDAFVTFRVCVDAGCHTAVAFRMGGVIACHGFAPFGVRPHFQCGSVAALGVRARTGRYRCISLGMAVRAERSGHYIDSVSSMQSDRGGQCN